MVLKKPKLPLICHQAWEFQNLFQEKICFLSTSLFPPFMEIKFEFYHSNLFYVNVLNYCYCYLWLILIFVEEEWSS